ncbi:MAG: NAD(P)/FAD-dependent oxidoreductase [Deltaproteobacteria bacterium]|nr:NAD(P)/FAD-dependent oxidoreductase [Deltaproteobacteria bacterium]
MAKTENTEVIVVGGGLAGLTAAAYLARAGRAVTVFERSNALGGRAATHVKDQFSLNLGPHALYRGGAGIRILRELGVPFDGGSPSVSGGYAVDKGRVHTLPGGLLSLLTTGLLPVGGKIELARVLGSLQKINTDTIQRTSVRQWLDSTIRHPQTRSVVQALTRLSSYANEPERQSAGTAVAQVQIALARSVMYPNGGWQVLVDGLRRIAEAAGVRICGGSRVVAVEHDDAARGVRLADGTSHRATAVIVALGASEAAGLLSDSPVGRWAAAAVPVKAACLDVALRRVPRPAASFALGIDRPLYFSIHSAVAKLAPAPGAVMHAAKYLSSEPSDPKSDEQELEQLLDLVQPGWRSEVVERRFLPNMVACSALATAEMGGIGGRPGVEVPEIRNLYVAGDWVGSQGWLADGSLASAKRAAQLAIAGAAGAGALAA